jgi:hypothetical protein
MGLTLSRRTSAARPPPPAPDYIFSGIVAEKNPSEVITDTGAVDLDDEHQNISWYKFTITPTTTDTGQPNIGMYLQADTIGSAVSDTVMGLYHGNGTLLAQDNDTGGSGKSYIAPGLLAPGQYFIGVCEFTSTLVFQDNWATNINPPLGSDETTLNLTFGPVPDKDLGTLGDGTHGGEITSFHDSHPNIIWTAFALTATKTVVMDTLGTHDPSDTVMGLYSADGVLIENNDEGPGISPKSKITRSLDAGDYLIGVMLWSTNQEFLTDWTTGATPVGSGKLVHVNIDVS